MLTHNYPFVVKPWGDANRSIILKIMNIYLKYQSPENFFEHKQDILQKMFGSDTDYSRDVLRFENEKGKIVGFAGITNNSGDYKNWRIAYHILPEYLNTSLTNTMIKTCISLAKESNKSEMLFRTRGMDNEFDKALKALGYNPIHYMWGMNMIDIDSKVIPIAKTPKGIIFQHVEDLEDYTGYVRVRNETFRGTFEYNETTPEEQKKHMEFQKTYFTVRFFVAYDKETLVGYGSVVTDKKNNITYGRTLAVLPEYQNRRIGSELIRRVLEFLQKEKIKEYRFHVDGKNARAMELYKRFGFRELEKATFKFYSLK